MPRVLDGVEPLHRQSRIIPAKDYNRVRLALGRLGNPLQVPLESMRCLEMVLEDRTWRCIDTCMFDRPILAWTAFETETRSGIHEPITCELRFYHVHGGLVMGEILETLGRVLQGRLDPRRVREQEE